MRVLDVFRDEVLNTSIRVETGGRRHVNTRVPLFAADRRGSYRVTVEAKVGDVAEREVLTIGVLKPVARADPFFGFNHKQVFNDDAERRYADNNEQRELVYANSSLTYTLGLMRKAGASSLRCFRTAEYQKIELPSGEYVWRDTYLDLQRQAGLNGPLVVLRARGPTWDADPAFPDARGGRRGRIPTIEEWRKYVQAMVSHYRGKVRYYEVVNEPETIFRDVHVYVDRLKVAHDTIRETDPEARIVAPSYSGSRPLPWLGKFCEAGGHRWVDIWAIHYAGRTLPERGMDRTTPTWELIRAYREILVAANDGVDKPFWNTEGGSFYWNPEYDHWPVAADQGRLDINGEHFRIPNETLVAAYTPRLQLIEKASGLDREYSFEFGFYYSQNASKATDLWSMYVNYDGSPSPALVTYNAVAEIFAGTSPVDILPLQHGVIVTVFERDGTCVAALWKGAPVAEYPGFEKFDCAVRVDVDIPAPALALTNMLGHPLTPEVQGNGVRLIATAFPLYFTSALAPQQIVAAFRSAAYALGPRPPIDATPRELMEVGQYSAAIEALQAHLAATPGDKEALTETGTCYSKLRKYAEAETFFRRALLLDPDSVRANAGMATCFQNAATPGLPWGERMAKAAAYMGKAVGPTVDRVNRERQGSYTDLADIYQCFYFLQGSTHVPGNAAEALRLLQTAKHIDPQAGNFRTKRMVTAEPKLKARAQKDNARN